MKLIMAVSRDGYLAREKNDPMGWLGSTDKAIFRILTGVDRGPCIVSEPTRLNMPPELPGRKLIAVSRYKLSLADASALYPQAWLLGGPTLAMVALSQGLVSEVHLCRSDRYAFPDPMASGAIGNCITPFLRSKPMVSGAQSWWVQDMSTKILDVTVDRWRFHVFSGT